MKGEHSAPGIPDEYFHRESVPMTKEEIRAITVSKARIKEDSIVYDIGAGTGSISIEAAVLAKKGRVYAVEKDASRRGVIEKNVSKFRLKNIEIINGDAPRVLEGLPEADRIIVGGSGGAIGEILMKCSKKLARNGIIIVNAITLETLNSAVSVLENLKFNLDITQVSIAKMRKLGKGRALEALNPVFIIQGFRGEGE